MSLMVDVQGLSLDAADRELFQHPEVSGFILFGRNVESVEQVAELVRQVRGVRPDVLIAIDYEGGRVQRIRSGVTRIPPMQLLGAQPEAEQLAYDAGLVIGAELAALDIDVPFAPVVDLDYGCSSVIGDRAFATEPSRVVTLAQALIQGLDAAGLAATLKHFPGHGAVVPDSHLELPVDARAAECIAERDLRPFAELIRQGVPSVMTAHVVYSTVDDRPASFSPVWIGEWLRGRLGFSGCVISDDLTMAGAAAVGSPSDRVRLATEAGCDLLPMCNSRANVEQALTAMPAAEPSGARQRVRALRRRERVVAPEQLEAARRRLEAISWT